ncbi:MAG: YidC/Oxa1 family membrane protein insertase [Ktedonobacterales bacterium]
MQALQQFLGPLGGIFHYVFYQPVYNILMVLYGAFHIFLPSGAFALAIVVLTLILRSCLIPLTRKQLKSSRAMQELQPRLKELQTRYKDPQERMAAQQALYKEHGVNPVSGCLPLVIQMPFIYALYGAFENVIYAHGSLLKVNQDLYSFVPHLAHLPETGFFWTSLATPDPTHILPVIAAVLTFLQLRMALPVRKPAAAGQKDSMSQATGMMQYIMPIFTLVIGLSFPAGLALYWCVSTCFSAVQQYFLTGVGSLFVGIPGLEHLVPEPKDVALATPAKALSAGSARGLVASAPTEPGAGGLRGMLRQLREQLSSVQQTAVETQQAKQNGNAQNAAKSATTTSGDASESLASAPKTAPRPARPRPQPKTGPVLVKPPINGATSAKTAPNAVPGNTSAASETAPAPAPAPTGSESLPEPAIANGNGNGNSASPSPRRERGQGGEVS